MKTYLKLTFLACLLLIAGCDDGKSGFQPLGSGGFGFVSKWIGIDSGPGAALFYKGNQSKPTMIWPFLEGGDLLFTNDIVFFEGAYPDAEGALVQNYYFAAQAPGPALEISQDLLKLWAESNRMDFEQIRRHYGPLKEQEAEHGIKIHFIADRNYPDATIVVGWDQISNIIQEVKHKGTKHEILKPHVVYLKID